MTYSNGLVNNKMGALYLASTASMSPSIAHYNHIKSVLHRQDSSNRRDTLFWPNYSSQMYKYRMSSIWRFQTHQVEVSQNSASLCPTDTLQVAFTKLGDFKPGNKFMLELSDSSGNFENYRLLAAITDTASGSFAVPIPSGVLPSSKYKVRVSSTMPRLYGYPGEQNLRIKARPLVSAGGPVAFCLGDTVALQAKGAQQFLWSPALAVSNDSAANPTYVAWLPDTLVLFGLDTITGCHHYDTLNISIKPLPQIDSVLFDSVICFGQFCSAKAFASLGQKAKHSFAWYLAANDSLLAVGDSLAFLPLHSADVYLTLFDSCAIVRDTFFISVQVLPPLSLKHALDSTLCFNQDYKQKALATGGNGSYQFVWFDRDAQMVLAQSDSVLIESVQSVKNLLLRFGDACSLSDSVAFTLQVRDPLQAAILADDTLHCINRPFWLKAQAQGGNGQYVYQWQHLGIADSVSVNIVADSVFHLIVSDGCSLPDTAAYPAKVFDKLSLLSAKDTALCSGLPLWLWAKALGGRENTTIYLWQPGNIQNDSLLVYPSQTTTYSLTVSDACVASVNKNITITVLPKPDAGFIVSDTAGCQPLETEFTAMHMETGSNTAQFEWYFGDGNTATTSGQQSLIKHTYANAGVYTPGLVVRSACVDSSMGNSIVVHELPKADFSFSPLNPDLEDPNISFKNRSNGASRFEWDFGDGQSSTLNNPQHRYTQSGAYLVGLWAASDFGCFDFKTDTLFISDIVSVYMPNSFTPNGDGLNDVFGPEGSGIQSFRLQVFNRWGAVVFDSELSQAFWNGKLNNTAEKVTEGVYLYIATIQDIKGNRIPLKGTVVLKR